MNCKALFVSHDSHRWKHILMIYDFRVLLPDDDHVMTARRNLPLRFCSFHPSMIVESTSTLNILSCISCHDSCMLKQLVASKSLTRSLLPKIQKMASYFMSGESHFCKDMYIKTSLHRRAFLIWRSDHAFSSEC